MVHIVNGKIKARKELIKKMEKSLKESGQNEKAINAAKKMSNLFTVHRDGIITIKK